MKYWMDRSRVQRSSYFDADWYRLTYAADIDATRLAPIDHFLRIGAAKRYAPGPRFHAAWYVTRYPDLSAIANPLLHFVRHGSREGRMPTPGDDARLDALREKIGKSGLFDAAWYTATYSDVPADIMSPLDHFLFFGLGEARAPGPEFDPHWYMLQNPDVLASGKNALEHFIDNGRAEGRYPYPPPGVLECAEATFRGVRDLEPALGCNIDLSNLASLQIVTGHMKGAAFRAFETLFESLTHPYEVMICVPWLAHSGADRFAVNAARALTQALGDGAVLVVICDGGRLTAADWLCDGADLRILGGEEPLDNAERMEALWWLVQALCPARLINVNSRACWDLIATRGRAFAHLTRIYASIFCPDYAEDGREIGYSASHLREALPFLTGVLLDNHTFAGQLTDSLALPRSVQPKLHVLTQPVEESHPAIVSPSERSRFCVLWAGRFCRQKNVDLLLEIVAGTPDIDYEVWGYGEERFEIMMREAAARHPNLRLPGTYARFSDLPIETYGAYLYTSLWDGIPNVLLEAAAGGLAVVASLCGGIGEVVTGETGWPIAHVDDPSAYIAALRYIRDRPQDTAVKRRNMAALIRENHSWPGYLSRCEAAGLFESMVAK